MLPSFEIHSGQCPSTVAGGISSPFQCWRLEEEHHKSERGDLWISPNLSTCEISQVARLGHWHLCGISTCYFSESFTRWRAIQHCQREGSLNHLQWFSKAICSTAITHRELHEEAGACHAGAWQRQGHNQGPQRSMVASLLYSCWSQVHPKWKNDFSE